MEKPRSLNLTEFEARTARRNHLKGVDVQGSFDFSTAIINLNSLKKRDIEEARKLVIDYRPDWNDGKPNLLSGEQYTALAKVNPLAVHEYTHFVDSTSSLWGLRHLSLMSEAYNSKNEAEQGYHKAKKFFDHTRSLRLPSYYTVTDKNPHTNRPWIATPSIGRIFDKDGKISERPVLFSRFLNADKQMMVRSPISTVSILEASAMAQETFINTALLRLTSDDFRMIEERHFSRKHVDFLYSRELTEYSVCVHILANRVACKDAGVAFDMCARLTRGTLKFPLVLFKKLAAKCPIAKILNLSIEHEFVKAVRDGLRTQDLGVLYFLLCNALPRDVAESEEKFVSGLNAALCAMGIEMEEFAAEAAAEAKELFENLGKSTIENIRTLATAGYENFKSIHYFQDRLDFSNLHLPPVLLGDDTKVSIFDKETNLLRKFDIEACFFELDDGMSWVNRFSEACL